MNLKLFAGNREKMFHSRLSKFKSILFVAVLLFIPAHGYAQQWWSSISEEESVQVDTGVQYKRLLYKTITSQPVRAHILSVTGVGDDYIFGVLGSFGALFQPTAFAKQSGAVAVVNGGFFSVHPNRARGLVAAHNRILYPPHSGNYQGTVGFNSEDILFDWITPEDINENRFDSKKEGWNSCHSAVAAGPILIKDSSSCLHLADNFNLTERNPRTAIAEAESGAVLLIVVDGRQPDWSEGVSLVELADMLMALHAINAMNLDGGGSSTMVIKGEIKNRPSDFHLPGYPGKERAVANVVALFKK